MKFFGYEFSHLLGYNAGTVDANSKEEAIDIATQMINNEFTDSSEKHLALRTLEVYAI